MSGDADDMDAVFRRAIEQIVTEMPQAYREAKVLPSPMLFFMHPLGRGMSKFQIPDWAFDDKDRLCRTLSTALKLTGACAYVLIMQGWISKPDRIIGRLEDQPAPSKDPMRTEGIIIVSRSPLGKKRHVTIQCDLGEAEKIFDSDEPGASVQMLTPFADLLDP